MENQMKLLIVTPFKNEEASIARTVESICRQTVTPAGWILVDDHSDDASPDMVKRFAESISFIHYCLKTGEGGRATGKNVVDVFNFGLSAARSMGIEWDIVLKLDADLVIERADYLEFFLNKFLKYPALGIASGSTYIRSDQKRLVESRHRWHTQGPNKFYRKECLQAIGGLRPFKGWDGIDDILARHHGYITEKFFEQSLWHLYPTQTRQAEGGVKSGLLREAGSYQNRGYPFYMFLFKAFKLARSRKITHAFYFLGYGIRLKLLTRPLVTPEESRIVKAFLKNRFLNRIPYTSDL